MAARSDNPMLEIINNAVRVVIIGPNIEADIGAPGCSGIATTCVEGAIARWIKNTNGGVLKGERLWTNENFPFQLVSLATSNAGDQALIVKPTQPWERLILRIEQLKL